MAAECIGTLEAEMGRLQKVARELLMVAQGSHEIAHVCDDYVAISFACAAVVAARAALGAQP